MTGRLGPGVDAVEVEPDQADALRLGDRDQHVAVRRRRGVAEAAHGFLQVHVHRLDAAAQLHLVEAAEARPLPLAELLDDAGGGERLVVAGVVEQAGGDVDGVAEDVARHLDDLALGEPDLQLEGDRRPRRQGRRAACLPRPRPARRWPRRLGCPRPCRCAPASRACRRRRRRSRPASRTPPSGRRRASSRPGRRWAATMRARRATLRVTTAVASALPSVSYIDVLPRRSANSTVRCRTWVMPKPSSVSSVASL